MVPLGPVRQRQVAALDGADAFGRDLHRGIAGGARLVLGQRAIRGAEPQRQRQRLAALADLRARVHVEQSDVFEQSARAIADRSDDL